MKTTHEVLNSLGNSHLSAYNESNDPLIKLYHSLGIFTYGTADLILPPNDVEAGKDILTMGPIARPLALATGFGSFLIKSKIGKQTIKHGLNVAEKVHGNSLKSLKPTWGYKLYTKDGLFLKNGITSKPVPETRYTRSFMADKYMKVEPLFSNRRQAWDWEYLQNTIEKGKLNKNMH
ncbi:MAG: hypothetical protein O9346_13615 [Leptospiraceae bacterium]|nr:hypothetical protein [Leptospiraceae bacterium]MCZ8347447.1 hypothetical protein [Leptospiraceae bacterium]